VWSDLVTSSEAGIHAPEPDAGIDETSTPKPDVAACEPDGTGRFGVGGSRGASDPSEITASAADAALTKLANCSFVSVICLIYSDVSLLQSTCNLLICVITLFSNGLLLIYIYINIYFLFINKKKCVKIIF
jgi:hypothetical protein